MATYYSTEYANVNSNIRNSPNTEGLVMYRYAQVTGNALSSSDVTNVMKLPNGAKVHPSSFMIASDLEASASVNVGYAAYTDSDGSAVTLDADAFISALDGSSARTKTFFDESTTHDDGYSFTGVGDITVSLAAGTTVAGDTMDFHIYYTVGGE